MIDTDCKNFERVHVDELKDHQLRELVNDITKVARCYGNSQQLRERICGVVLSVLRPRRNHATEHDPVGEELIAIDDPILKGVHYKREPVTDEEKSLIVSGQGEFASSRLQELAQKLAQTTDPTLILNELTQMHRNTRLNAVNAVLTLLKDN